MEVSKQQNSLQAIITEAWGNEAFKKELMNDPKKAIESLVGHTITIPEGKELVVRDQTDQSKIYINIPQEPSIENVELTEEQLEAVAGGLLPGSLIGLGQYIEDILNHRSGEDGYQQ